MIEGFLRLIRLPNLFTAAADVIAGYFIAGKIASSAAPRTQSLTDLALLAAASACLYAAGTTLNDLFDMEHDRVHNPARPLPSGRVRPAWALTLVVVLLPLALLAAQIVSLPAVIDTAAIILLIFAYDTCTKRFRRVGPINMALIRMFNVLLGMQLLPTEVWAAPRYLPFPLVIFLYVAGLTILSRAEEVSSSVRSAVKYLVIGIIFLDSAMLMIYGLYKVSCVVLVLVIPVVLLSKRFHVS